MKIMSAKNFNKFLMSKEESDIIQKEIIINSNLKK